MLEGQEYRTLKQFALDEIAAQKEKILIEIMPNFPLKTVNEIRNFYDKLLKDISKMKEKTVAENNPEYVIKLNEVMNTSLRKLPPEILNNVEQNIQQLQKALGERKMHPREATQYGGKMEKPEKYGHSDQGFATEKVAMLEGNLRRYKNLETALLEQIKNPKSNDGSKEPVKVDELKQKLKAVQEIVKNTETKLKEAQQKLGGQKPVERAQPILPQSSAPSAQANESKVVEWKKGEVDKSTRRKP